MGQTAHVSTIHPLTVGFVAESLPPQLPPLSAAERIICLSVVDVKLVSPNGDPGYRDILPSGSLPF